MKMLFKLYLLGQLIALPFMVGAIGNALGGGSDTSYVPPRTEIAPGNSISAADLSVTHDLCASLESDAINPVHDGLQQLRLVTSELYGEEALDDCTGSPAR